MSMPAIGATRHMDLGPALPRSALPPSVAERLERRVHRKKVVPVEGPRYPGFRWEEWGDQEIGVVIRMACTGSGAEEIADELGDPMTHQGVACLLKNVEDMLPRRVRKHLYRREETA